MTCMGTSIETLSAIASVKQERFIVLDATQLVSQAFDLKAKVSANSTTQSESPQYLRRCDQRRQGVDLTQDPNDVSLRVAPMIRIERTSGASAHLGTQRPNVSAINFSVASSNELPISHTCATGLDVQDEGDQVESAILERTNSEISHYGGFRGDGKSMWRGTRKF